MGRSQAKAVRTASKNRQKEMRVFDNAARIFADSLPLREAIELPKARELRVLDRVFLTRRIVARRGVDHLLIERVLIAGESAVRAPVKISGKFLIALVRRQGPDVRTLPLHKEALPRRGRVAIELHYVV